MGFCPHRLIKAAAFPICAAVLQRLHCNAAALSFCLGNGLPEMAAVSDHVQVRERLLSLADRRSEAEHGPSHVVWLYPSR